MSGDVAGAVYQHPFVFWESAVQTAITEPKQLPQRTHRITLASVINSDSSRVAVSEAELERMLSGGRAVGRAKVYYTSHPSLDILQTLRDGLRRL